MEDGRRASNSQPAAWYINGQPPRLVSLYFSDMSLPVRRLASIHASRGTKCEPSPLSAREAAGMALTAPNALRSIHGTLTKPATGSQVILRWCSSGDFGGVHKFVQKFHGCFEGSTCLCRRCQPVNNLAHSIRINRRRKKACRTIPGRPPSHLYPTPVASAFCGQGHSPRNRLSRKLPAVTLGPMVCEFDGPIPIFVHIENGKEPIGSLLAIEEIVAEVRA